MGDINAHMSCDLGRRGSVTIHVSTKYQDYDSKVPEFSLRVYREGDYEDSKDVELENVSLEDIKGLHKLLGTLIQFAEME